MAPPTAKTPPKTEGSPPDQTPACQIDDFFSFLDQYCSQGKYRELRAVLKESEHLGEKLSELRIAYKTNLEEQAQLRNDFGVERREYEQQLRDEKSRYDQALKEKEAGERAVKAEREGSAKLKSEILSRDESIRRMTQTTKKSETQITKLDNMCRAQAAALAKAETREAQLKAELEAKTSQLSIQSVDLAKTQQGLETVQSFIVPLANLEEQRDQVCASLDSTFSEALGFFYNFFQGDLDKAVLENRAPWDSVKGHPSMHRAIPLPASNSPPAKKMRAIAALIVYAYALAKHAFRPTYVIQNGHDDLDQVLDALATKCPLQEAYVRAVLLKISPDGHEMLRETCASLVANETMGTVGGWLSTKQRDGFYASVKRLCDAACRGWERIQHLEDSVRPCFTFGPPEEWQRLPSSAPAKAHNGTAREAPPPDERQRQQHAGRPDMLQESDVVTVVWPAFLASSPSQADDEAPDLLHSGYVLTRMDIEDADAEVSRRAVRKAHRRSDSTARKPRRDSGIFLSPGGLGGPGDK